MVPGDERQVVSAKLNRLFNEHAETLSKVFTPDEMLDRLPARSPDVQRQPGVGVAMGH